MEKDPEIKKELRKLKKIFADIPENKKQLCGNLIQNAAFMAVTLRELQEEVLLNGAIIPTKSGNGFETIKDNPAQKAYTTMIARYAQVIGQLQGLLPDQKSEAAAKAGDALKQFISAGKPD